MDDNKYELSLSMSAEMPENHRQIIEAKTFAEKVYPLISDGGYYSIRVKRITIPEPDDTRIQVSFYISKVRHETFVPKWFKLSWRGRLRVLFTGGYWT